MLDTVISYSPGFIRDHINGLGTLRDGIRADLETKGQTEKSKVEEFVYGFSSMSLYTQWIFGGIALATWYFSPAMPVVLLTISVMSAVISYISYQWTTQLEQIQMILNVTPQQRMDKGDIAQLVTMAAKNLKIFSLIGRFAIQSHLTELITKIEAHITDETQAITVDSKITNWVLEFFIPPKNLNQNEGGKGGTPGEGGVERPLVNEPPPPSNFTHSSSVHGGHSESRLISTDYPQYGGMGGVSPSPSPSPSPHTTFSSGGGYNSSFSSNQPESRTHPFYSETHGSEGGGFGGGRYDSIPPNVIRAFEVRDDETSMLNQVQTAISNLQQDPQHAASDWNPQVRQAVVRNLAVEHSQNPDWVTGALGKDVDARRQEVQDQLTSSF